MTRHSFVNVVVPFDPARADDVDRAIARLADPDGGNRPSQPVESRLRGFRRLHFMSITVARPVCPAEEDGTPREPPAQDERAHLLIEMTVDGGTDAALADLTLCFGDSLLPLLAAAQVGFQADRIQEFLGKHCVEIRDSWSFGAALGQVFDGAPGMSAERIRQERELAAVLDKEVEALHGDDRSPRQKLDAIRARLWNDPEASWKWAFVAEPSPLLGGAPDGALSVVNPRMWRVVAQIAQRLFWPPLLLAAVAVAASYAFARVHDGAIVALLWAWWVAWSLGGVFLLFLVLAAVRLRALERTDAVESRPPSLKHGEQLLSVENFQEQNHLASISRLKGGLLRRLALRLAFVIVGTGRWVCAPGFLGKNGVIHFARWMRLPGTDQLLFWSNFDGTWESYVADFIADAPTGVTAIWSNCVGFPRTRLLFGGGAADRDRLVLWARRQQHPTRLWYSAYRGLTNERIRTNAAIRQGFATAESFQDCQDWLALFGSAPRPANALQLTEMTTLAFGGLSRLRFSTCLGLAFKDAAATTANKRFLADLAPDLKYGEALLTWPAALVLGLSWRGMRCLGLDGDALETFPVAFKQGMWDASRARLLGDVGHHAPDAWTWGGAHKQVDVFLVAYAVDAVELDSLVTKVRESAEARGLALVFEQGLTPRISKAAAASAGTSVREPFGFSDGLSQPIIRGLPGAKLRKQPPEQIVEAGEFFYGYPDNTGVIPPAPTVAAGGDPQHRLPDADANPFRKRPEFSSYEGMGRRDLGANGTYLVVRQLEQNVEAFDTWCDSHGVAQLKQHALAVAAPAGNPAQAPGSTPPMAPALKEVVQAKMMGRWKDGTSLVRNSEPPDPGDANPHRDRGNDFLFGAEDPSGLACPFGAHIRRANPRDARFPGSSEEIASVNRHRLLRVGRIYGELQSESPWQLSREEPQGLMFMCLNVDIERQFEFVQKTWILNPNIHGLKGEVDPILGHGENRPFTIPTSRGAICLTGLPEFTRVRGGGYFFIPGRALLQYLAAPGSDGPDPRPLAASAPIASSSHGAVPAGRDPAPASRAGTAAASRETIRVLSLDGGGSRAGILARALGEIYGPDRPGREIVRQFACVAGNSGGSIVLAALCCNYTPRQIAGFYDDVATLDRMFCPKWNADVPILNWGPHYSTRRKLESLRDILDRSLQPGEPPPSTIKLADWPQYLGGEVAFLIPAFDLDRQRTTFFRSNATSRAKSSEPGLDITLLQAVHASTTAPVIYFDRPARVLGRSYWDGGLGGYDNPVFAAVVEMLANRPGCAPALRVLSIGTSSQARPPASVEAPPPIGKRSPVGCWLREAALAASVIFDDPPDAATFHAHVALGQPMPQPGEARPVAGSVVRMSPFIRPLWGGAHWEIPEGLTEQEFEALFRMKLDVRDREGVALIGKMTQLWIEGRLPNQPVRAGQRFQCDIGDDTFPEALARWRAIS